MFRLVSGGVSQLTSNSQLSISAAAVTSCHILPLQGHRQLSTSSCHLRWDDMKTMNFNSILVHNRRGTRKFKKEHFKKFEKPSKFPDVPIHKYGTRSTGIRHEGRWEHIPEMVPELIVPDLTDCKLKPYVSYATKEIYQEELNSKDLFNVIYGKKIIMDFKAGKLDENGNSLEPSAEEQMTPSEARTRARRTGSDIFQGGRPPSAIHQLPLPVGKL